MALGVDRAFLDSSFQMEHRPYGRWKSRIPEFIQSGQTRPLTQEPGNGSRQLHDQDDKGSYRERSTSKKTVTMAPTSRCITNRRLYTSRKPLITAEKQISILKNPLPQECSDTVHMSSVLNCPKDMEGMLSKPSDPYTTETISNPRVIASSPSASREDLYGSLSLSDLRLSSPLGEHDFSSVPSTSKNERRSLSSPTLYDLSPSVSVNPKWSSIQQTFSHSYTSQTRPSRSTKTRVFEQDKDSVLKTLRYKDYSSRLKPMSNYQANYWACAIPNSLPPSPDRKSPSWDPDREYQALLDYTYPLKPNMDNTCRSLLRTDPLLEDSGIELDRFCSSSSLSYLDQSLPGISRTRSSPTSGQRSSERQSLNLRDLSHSKSSDGRFSSSLYSSLDHMGLSVESLNCEGKHFQKCGIFTTSRSAPTFIRSTSILPQPGSLGELDGDFLRLPEQLQELQDLSHQLRDITAHMNQTVNTSCESLEKGSASGTNSAAKVELQAADISILCEDEDEIGRRSVSEVPLQSDRFSEQLKGLSAKVQMISSEVNKGSLREVEAILEQLHGTSRSEFQRLTGTNHGQEETNESLLQHIQAFCSNLGELIQWLYKVVNKLEVLSPPSVDIESVKASLADYKSFQKEIQAHQPLTASVLQTGEMLLCCMNSASPFLKETLMLIERQSRVLETHSEHLFSSILSAMDCLTEPSGQDNTEMMS